MDILNYTPYGINTPYEGEFGDDRKTKGQLRLNPENESYENFDNLGNFSAEIDGSRECQGKTRLQLDVVDVSRDETGGV